jgi:hypothetical protein
MHATAVYPHAAIGSGMYESFYLRAVSPEEPVGVWIRHTVHKAPGRPPRGAVWCTVFDARSGRPFMHKQGDEPLSVPAGGWIAVGEHASMGADRAEGSCGPARWSLRFSAEQPELRHLRPEFLYRAPFPRTKLTSPAPIASFDGVLELEGRPAIELRGWPGMVGHNWGREHAERWIWLHGVGFEGAPQAWIDVALGRLLIGGRMTPWVANGALCLDGRRHRLGGLLARGLRVSETPDGCQLQIPGAGGLTLAARVDVPAQAAAGWRYADPDGAEHHVINCSVSALQLDMKPAGAHRTLRTDHGCAYELGMREQDHGVPLAPFADG